MLAFHSQRDTLKRDEIASRQLHAPRGYQSPREKKLRVHDGPTLLEGLRVAFQD